jgi:lipoprotein NlpD
LKRALAIALMAVAVLGACTHARVVQREPGAYRATPPPPRPAVSPIPRDGVHVVQRGETLYGISFRYGLNYRDVATWNRIADPYLIDIGQRLRLKPSRGAPIASAPPAQPGPRPAPAQPITSTSPSVSSTPPRPVTAPPVSTTVQPTPAAPRPVAPMPAPVAIAGAPSWQWPTQGEVIGRFASGDQTRQGVDIAGKSGQDVRASADGVVVYSGAGLVGYGELIIVKHSEEWLSAYAHNQQRLVSEGTRVSAGQVIAKLGRTGAPRDMLHFEIRRNGKPVDPLGLLPRR